MKILQGRVTDYGNGFDVGETVCFRVVMPATEKNRDLSQYIYSEFADSTCTHEYDCCGCPHYWVDVKRVSSREYFVRHRTFYNY